MKFEEALNKLVADATMLSMSYLKSHDGELLDEFIAAEFDSDMNGIVGYNVWACIGGRLYCCDERPESVEDLIVNYNAMMWYYDLTPRGACMLADGIIELQNNKQ